MHPSFVSNTFNASIGRYVYPCRVDGLGKFGYYFRDEYNQESYKHLGEVDWHFLDFGSQEHGHRVQQGHCATGHLQELLHLYISHHLEGGVEQNWVLLIQYSYKIETYSLKHKEYKYL